MQDVMVRLKDADHARVGKGLAAVRAVLQERLARRAVDVAEVEQPCPHGGPDLPPAVLGAPVPTLPA